MTGPAAAYRFGAFELRPRERKLLRDGREEALGGRALEILICLVEANGGVISKEALFARVWPDTVVGENNLHAQISTLRKALGEHGAAIATTAGRGYRFTGAIETLEPPAAPALRHGRGAAARPSIAVLPFANLSSDPEQGFFAQGMAEELITALSRMRWLFVVARNSSFAFRDRGADVATIGAELGVRYVVSGSVRRALQRLRISCHLIDTTNQTEIWSDRFDGDMENVFDLQDRIAASIVGAIEPQLREVEVDRARAKPTQDLAAYDHYLRALGHLSPRTAENYEKALVELDAALALDGDFALALALAGYCRCERLVQGWSSDADAEREAMARLSEAAIARGGRDPTVLFHAALVLAWCGRGLPASLQLVERATALNPNSAFGAYVDGWLRLQSGQPDQAIGRFEAALALSPLDALWSAAAMVGTGQAHLLAGRHGDAVLWAQRAVRQAPDLGSGRRIHAAALALAGREEEAAEAARALLAMEPGFTVGAFLARLPIRDTLATQRLADGLRRAGLP